MFRAKGYGAKRSIILETPRKVVETKEQTQTKILEEPKATVEEKTVLTETVQEPVELNTIVDDVIEDEDKPKKKGRKKKAE